MRETLLSPVRMDLGEWKKGEETIKVKCCSEAFFGNYINKYLFKISVSLRAIYLLSLVFSLLFFQRCES